MKKVGIISLVLVLLLGLGAMSVYAKARKIELWPGDPGFAVEGASGWFIVNVADNTQTIIQVQVRGLTPNTTYYVHSSAQSWSFTTNRAGHGHLHFSLAAPPATVPEGFNGWITIRTKDKPGLNRVLYRKPDQTTYPWYL